METKRVYHLKTWPKVVLVILILLGIGLYYANERYKEYLYTLTYEYKFIQAGYSMEEYQTINDNLTEEEMDHVLSYEYNEFIPEFVKQKYFMFKNLDGYLSQVITQDEDFFKYHGTEGYDYEHIVAMVNVGSINEPYEDVKKTDFSKGYGLLANKYYDLGMSYEPDDLVAIDIRYRYDGDKKIRKEAYENFLKMWEDAYSTGIYLIVEDAYRSASEQERVYKSYEEYKDIKYADSIAARPGFSEHQTGLALDIYSKECATANAFKDSNSYKWLAANSYKYGFIVRYPEGEKAEELTGYKFEPWHYRYLGVELATKVYEEGITYDEYYAYYMDS